MQTKDTLLKVPPEVQRKIFKNVGFSDQFLRHKPKDNQDQESLPHRGWDRESMDVHEWLFGFGFVVVFYSAWEGPSAWVFA